MIFRKVEHVQKSGQLTNEYNPGLKSGEYEMHTVLRLITTYWFLFIPIYQKKEILKHSNKLE
jgi:hypothetical protein